MYEPLKIKKYAEIRDRETAEGIYMYKLIVIIFPFKFVLNYFVIFSLLARYWKKFKENSILKHNFGVSDLSFSPVNTNALSVACGPR